MDPRLPPGPRERFPGENLLALHRDPLGYFERLQRDYGDIVFFRGGRLNGFLITHPNLIKEVLVTHNRALPIGLWQRQARRLLGQGLVTSEGDYHLQQRRLVSPSFHHTRLVDLSRCSADYAARWCEQLRAGQVVEMGTEMWKLTLNIVAQSLFSTSVESELEELNRSIIGLVELASPAMLYFADSLTRLPLPFAKRFERARARLDATIYRIIAEHRAAGDMGDLLSMLLAAQSESGGRMNDEQLRDETLTLLTSGHGTTSIALMWAFYLLSQHPEVEARLQHEVDTVLGDRLATVRDLPELRFARQVLAEALRLYPPVWAQDREATQELTIGGYTIPKGSVVLVSQWVTQRDPRFFPDPARFDPDRWENRPDTQQLHTGYFPFGAGPRVCIGEDYAWMNGTLILATIARRWCFRRDSQKPVVLFPRSGLGARGGMWLRAASRAAASTPSFACVKS
jgi:cytochrome P450